MQLELMDNKDPDLISSRDLVFFLSYAIWIS
jgi:hypothetical protein